MLINRKTFITSITITIFVSGCAFIKQTEEKLFKTNVNKSITEKKSLTISCDNGNINTYIKEGWRIINKQERDITCTWKSKPSKPNCNIRKDKGCLITVPDKIGVEVIYTIEKESTINVK